MNFYNKILNIKGGNTEKLIDEADKLAMKKDGAASFAELFDSEE